MCINFAQMTPSFLDTPISYLKGIGPQRAEVLQKELFIFTYKDLITHYPFRYVDRTQFHSVREVVEDLAYYQLRGHIIEIDFVGDKRTKRLVAKFRDSSGIIELVWFQGAKWMAEKLKSNTEYIAYGKATSFMGRFNMAHPEIDLVNVKRSELEKHQEEHIRRLEKIANLSAEDAKQQLIESLKSEAHTQALVLQQEIIEDAKQKANKEAKKIIIQSIQRTAAEVAIENTVTVFNLESDEMKGQIIGREGRNIRAIEAATGVDLIVDDTPEAILLSSFDPLRREIARLSLQRLVADGRIHPARIEEVVDKTRRQLEEQIAEIGERTVIELGIHGLHKELIRIIGKMRFRSSYGQNLLMHSRETANLCGIMAAELGINPKLAKRAGLLHDIGKVPDEETELSHALLGAKLAEKYGENPAVVNAIGAHHDEMEMQYVISPIIQACDAISGARPGARREIMQQYIQRIKDLENLAMNYQGVEKAYAIQAGRELRVIVEAEKVTDQTSDQLSFDIAQKIQTEMTYPGQIKVTVIREKRAVNIAR